MEHSVLALQLFGIAILAFLVVAFAVWQYSPTRKGKVGERVVAGRLIRGLSDEYVILNDVFLPLPDCATTQIDHVVVSRFGVFAIETKAYSGWIFGSEKSSRWMQSIYRVRSYFQNPLRQNYAHVCALAQCLEMDISCIHGVVAFAGNGIIKTEVPENVVYDEGVSSYIRRFDSAVISPEKVRDIADKIKSLDDTIGEDGKKQHVKNLYVHHSRLHTEATQRCPQCGGQMVLRHRRSDGRPFYGCKRYPHCRGIVSIENT